MCEPKIYVADLAAYNSGFLHGVWIDATDEPDDMFEQINTMLAASPVEDAEEFALHDYEGFGGFRLCEYTGINQAHEIACFIEQHGEVGGAVLCQWCGDLDAAQKAMDEDYCGRYTSLSDFAQEITEDTTAIPESLQYYIDYERMARDIEMSGDVYTIQTAHDEVHVFWNR